MRKQSIRQGSWRIGRRRRRKQTGGSFPISALAGPILDRITSNVAGTLSKK